MHLLLYGTRMMCAALPIQVETRFYSMQWCASLKFQTWSLWACLLRSLVRCFCLFCFERILLRLKTYRVIQYQIACRWWKCCASYLTFQRHWTPFKGIQMLVSNPYQWRNCVSNMENKIIVTNDSMNEGNRNCILQMVHAFASRGQSIWTNRIFWPGGYCRNYLLFLEL